MNTESTPDPEANEEPELFVAAPRPLSPLDQKILQHFPGLVVRKDLTKGLKQNAVVPTYVLEYLLGKYCATDDPGLPHPRSAQPGAAHRPVPDRVPADP